MTKPPMTDQQLIEYSGEHLLHELSMLWELAEELAQRKAGTVTSALVESFAVHLRNLIDFFYREGRSDDVTAEDFLDAITAWNPTEPSLLKTAHQRANKELTHLTQSRISGNPPEKAWPTWSLLKEIEAVAKEFATKASDKKLHPKVREFLQLPPDRMYVWIGENVTHINVAVQAVTSAVLDGASTATVIIHKRPLVE